MKIGNSTVVSLGYSLEIDEAGSPMVVDKADLGKPLSFIFGSGMLLPEFEKNIEGKQMGDRFDFNIKAENGYGLSDPINIIKMPFDSFKDKDGNSDPDVIKVGNVIPMMDNEGNQFQGIIKEVGTTEVTMDYNHPLADKDLHFQGEIFDVRIATPDELQHGHVHGEGGHQH
ncbi:MAG: FKBP-type peptidyl-prolyl cis-trans isomerase [Ignavibacteria bacterium]|nr:FKBP-type peptidyl-prolyl cis-trans isomerase [Ignavibacteria bacterium]